jgi:ATP-dependent Clp protease ATP-binding subunit ClpB
VAVDHLLQAVVESDKQVADILKEAGLPKELIAESIKQVRGSHNVTGKNSDETYDALNKYGVDYCKFKSELFLHKKYTRMVGVDFRIIIILVFQRMIFA